MEELIIGRQDAMLQRRKPRADAFTPAKRKRFLAALAATCNAALAARHAGVDKTTPYYHRTRDATFRAQWQAAIEEGYDRLEELVLLHGGAGQPLELDADDAPDADAVRECGDRRYVAPGRPRDLDGLPRATNFTGHSFACAHGLVHLARQRLGGVSPSS